ncbi:UNVERIFIED_CONTAM: hypothetical protein FKN15_047522 [Acipenser sinensis]
MSNGYRTISQHLNDLKKENFSLKLRIYFLEERMQQKYEDSSGDVYKRHLNDLKKENFSLKLRIYFLEERMQQKYEDSSGDVYKRNIELKVEVESLKQELQEKQPLLDKALTTAESLTNHNEAELQRRCEERQQEIDHMQEILETKIQLLQEEAKLAKNEAERMAALAEAETLRCMDLEKRLNENPKENADHPSLWNQHALADRDRTIDQLTQALRSKDAVITELSDEKTFLNERVGGLGDQVLELTSSLQEKETDVEGLFPQFRVDESRCVADRVLTKTGGKIPFTLFAVTGLDAQSVNVTI